MNARCITIEFEEFLNLFESSLLKSGKAETWEGTVNVPFDPTKMSYIKGYLYQSYSNDPGRTFSESLVWDEEYGELIRDGYSLDDIYSIKITRCWTIDVDISNGENYIKFIYCPDTNDIMVHLIRGNAFRDWHIDPSNHFAKFINSVDIIDGVLYRDLSLRRELEPGTQLLEQPEEEPDYPCYY